MIAHSSYIYRYRTGVIRNGPKAQYKGQILGYVPTNPTDVARSELFDFLAPNDATAFAYLMAHFSPDDTRPLQSMTALGQARHGPFVSADLSCRLTDGLDTAGRPLNL